MQECRVCGLLFLGGGACPSCGSQVAVDVPIEALEILPNIPDVRWIDESLARKDRKDVGGGVMDWSDYGGLV